MTGEYAVLIKRDSNNRIISYYYPDFNFEHHYTESEAVNLHEAAPIHLEEDIISRVTDHIEEISTSKSIPFPKKLTYYKQLIPINAVDHWGLCQINPFFIHKTEKYLPLFGVFSSIMAAITMAIINFYTTKESINSKAGIAIGDNANIFL